MGEAKRRGTREQRIQQSFDKYQAGSIDELKAAAEVPAHAEFLGYVVHLPKSDEFMALQVDQDGVEVTGWTPLPGAAARFGFKEGVAAVRSVARDDRDTVLAHLWDLGDQYYVTFERD